MSESKQASTPPQYPERSKNLSPEEQEAYLKHEEAMRQASQPYVSEMETTKRSWGIEPTAGVSHSVMIEGRWVNLGDVQLAEWQQEQRSRFFEEVIPEYRQQKAENERLYQEEVNRYNLEEATAWKKYAEDIAVYSKQVYARHEKVQEYVAASKAHQEQKRESKDFYESIGYGQFAGKYDPFEIPEGSVVKDIQEIKDNPFTPEIESGLNITFQGTNIFQESPTALKSAYLGDESKNIANFGLTPYQIAEQARHYGIDVKGKSPQEVMDAVALQSLEDAQAKATERGGVAFGVGGTWEAPSVPTKPHLFPTAIDVAKQQVERSIALGGPKTAIFNKPFEPTNISLTPTTIIKSEVSNVKVQSLTKGIFNVNPITPVNISFSPEKNLFGEASKPQRFMAGIVGSFETYVNPEIPTFSGTLLGGTKKGVAGFTPFLPSFTTPVGGQLEGVRNLQSQWGTSYMAGTIVGDIFQSILFTKGIEVAEKRIGDSVIGKKLDDFMLKHSQAYRDKVDDILRGRPQFVSGPSFEPEELVAPAKSIMDASDMAWSLESTAGSSGVTANQLANLSDEATQFLAFRQAEAGSKIGDAFLSGVGHYAPVTTGFGGEIGKLPIGYSDEVAKSIHLLDTFDETAKGVSIEGAKLITPTASPKEVLDISDSFLRGTQGTLTQGATKIGKGSVTSIAELTRIDPITRAILNPVSSEIVSGFGVTVPKIVPQVSWAGILGITTARAITELPAPSETLIVEREATHYTPATLPNINSIRIENTGITKQNDFTIPIISSPQTFRAKQDTEVLQSLGNIEETISDSNIANNLKHAFPTAYDIPQPQREQEKAIIIPKVGNLPRVVPLQVPDIISGIVQGIEEGQIQDQQQAQQQQQEYKQITEQTTMTTETPKTFTGPSPTFLRPPRFNIDIPQLSKKPLKVSKPPFGWKKQKLLYPIAMPSSLIKFKKVKNPFKTKESKTFKVRLDNMLKAEMVNPFKTKPRKTLRKTHKRKTK